MTKKKTKTPKPLTMAEQLQIEAQQRADKITKALHKKYENVVSPKPHLMTRIFPLTNCSVDSIAMRELDGEDDIMSSFWADKHATEPIRQSKAAAWIADQREGIRISLVGVNGVGVNQDGVPYMNCDAWTSKTWRTLAQCFAEMNGVPEEDLENAVRGSVVLGGGLAPTASMASAEEAQDNG